MIEPARVGAVILAAGASSRFGGQKLLAPLLGKPVLQHVLDTVTALGLGDTVVVLGEAGDELDAALGWRGERRIRNPDPGAGLSSSLRLGLGALGADLDAALVLLGDQPLVRIDVIEALCSAWDAQGATVVVPRYAGGGGANPVLVGRAAWPLAAQATGDRGLGPLLAARRDLVREIRVAGSNPDVDTRADLAALTALA